MLCHGCREIIDDPYYLMVVDCYWHPACLKCNDCGKLLESDSTCFARRGRMLCKSDYIKKYYSYSCERCREAIQPNELIFRVAQFIFHSTCFACDSCNTPLHPGDDYGLKENLVYCRDHLFKLDSYDSQATLDDSGYHTSPNETRRLIKNRQEEAEENHRTVSSAMPPVSYYLEIDHRLFNKAHYARQKRLRTSFKHHQLRCMRSYFNLNHNPDAKDLKSLSEKTNLPKRVLQVWFQNARAKYRRSHVLSTEEARIDLSPSSNSNGS